MTTAETAAPEPEAADAPKTEPPAVLCAHDEMVPLERLIQKSIELARMATGRVVLRQGYFIGKDLKPRIRSGRRKQGVVVCSWAECLECQTVFIRRPQRGYYCSQACYELMRQRRKADVAKDGLTHQQRHYMANKATYAQKHKAYVLKHDGKIKAYQKEHYLKGEGRNRKRIPISPMVSCSLCGRRFKRQFNQLNGRTKVYCGMKCRDLDYRKRFLGANSHLWQGGKTKEAQRLRGTAEYKEWRLKIFQRDGFCCQRCGVKDKTIEAHHLKLQSRFPELRFIQQNGITLCAKCHGHVHGWRKEIIEEPIFDAGSVLTWQKAQTRKVANG